MRPQITVVIPTREIPHPRVVSAVERLTYDRVNVLVQKLDRPVLDDDSVRAKYVNAAATRNGAREMLLEASRSTHFLWVDDDVVLPSDAIENLLFLRSEVAAGWYPVKGRNDRWVAGRWGADGNTFWAYRFPYVIGPNEPDDAPMGCVVEDEITGKRRLNPRVSDLVPLGCVLMTREILELIAFRPGVDMLNFDGETGQRVYLGDCMAFGDDLRSLGESCKMSHRVVCEHLEHPVNEPAEAVQEA